MGIRLGIDVGGTHTDAVLLTERDEILGKAKRPTTQDVLEGISQAVDAVLSATGVDPGNIAFAMLGTTQCTNAVVERRGLGSVGILRLGAPASLSVPPLTAWPEDLVRAIDPVVAVLPGGHEFDGTEIAPLDEAAICAFAAKCRSKRAIAVTSVFSPVSEMHEVRAADLIREVLGAEVPISASAHIGTMGLLERENATVLNAALTDVGRTATRAFADAMGGRRIKARLYFSQNDGTRMSLERASQYPIFTVASGPTNSLRGAAYLSGSANAVVIDVGGTTSDVGMLIHGFPRQSTVAVAIGGVPTNFRMPDLLSIGLGGGTRVHQRVDGLAIGPDSVGFRLHEEGLAFGGTELTLTDVAVAAGHTAIGKKALVAGLDSHLVLAALFEVRAMLEETVDRMKTAAGTVPVIAVGGGNFLVPPDLGGSSTVRMPDNGDVANAIGAAMAQVSGDVDRVYHLEALSRQQAVDDAKCNAVKLALEAGGDPDTVEIVDVEEVPLAYLPGNATRIRVKAAARLKETVRADG